MLRFAGRRHWYAAVLRHTGRKSGRRYATPVVAVPVEGGFVIPLPYGEGVDWLKNVRAADGAGLRFDGQDYELRSPEVVSASAVPDLDEEHLRVWQHYRIDRVVRLSSTPVVAPRTTGPVTRESSVSGPAGLIPSGDAVRPRGFLA